MSSARVKLSARSLQNKVLLRDRNGRAVVASLQKDAPKLAVCDPFSIGTGMQNVRTNRHNFKQTRSGRRNRLRPQRVNCYSDSGADDVCRAFGSRKPWLSTSRSLPKNSISKARFQRYRITSRECISISMTALWRSSIDHARDRNGTTTSRAVSSNVKPRKSLPRHPTSHVERKEHPSPSPIISLSLSLHGALRFAFLERSKHFDSSHRREAP